MNGKPASAGGTGPRVADVAFWPGSEHTLLAAWCVEIAVACLFAAIILSFILLVLFRCGACAALSFVRARAHARCLRLAPPRLLFLSDDRVLICDTRAAACGAGGSAAEPPGVRAVCGAVAPPRAHAARALALAFPSAQHDPWLVCVGGDDGALFSVDLRRPAAPLAALPAVHDGPVWRLCAGGDAAAAALLSAGDDGALRATPVRELRGVAAAAHAPQSALLLQTAHPLRSVAAGASSAAGAAAVAGDDTGRLHAVRLLGGATRG